MTVTELRQSFLFVAKALVVAVILVVSGIATACFAQGEKNDIHSYGLSAIVDNDTRSAYLLKEKLLEEAQQGKFTGPSHSMKITQTWAMFRGYYYLEVSKRFPDLFSDEERDSIIDWFVDITERTFTLEWSDIYYALAFRKKMTAPYRNQENGTGALIVFAEIIKHKRPDLAMKAIGYVRNNAVMWNRNFRNTDDSISYQAMWIYNCYNVARLLFPEWMKNEYSRRSFEWIRNQWPPDGSPLGYNPDPDVLIPDTMYLGAELHSDGSFKWLGNKMMEYALKRNMDLSGFRPGMEFKNNDVVTMKPVVGSVYMEGPGNLVQFPSEDKPDKIVFREGWDPDSFYALLNLRFDGWHGYKGTNSFISIRYGEPFVVEDLVKKSWKWLPEGRAKRRDENMSRSRFNGFQLAGGITRKILNKFSGFEGNWEQDLPKFAIVDDFITSDKIDYSRTKIASWHDWNNTRLCLLVKGDYFVVFDFNSGISEKQHAISWHVRGDMNNNSNDMILTHGDHSISLFVRSDNADLIIHNSAEPYPPQATLFEANHDVWIQAAGNHSEIVSLFWPHRGNRVLEVEKLGDTDSHLMSVAIKTENFQDIVLVKDADDNTVTHFENISFDSAFVLLRKEPHTTTIYHRGGTFVMYNGKRYDLKEKIGEITLSNADDGIILESGESQI